MIRTIFAILLIALPASAIQANDSIPSDNVNHFIKHTSETVVDVIKTNSDSRTTEQKLTKIFTDVMDINWMAKFAIGKKWLSMTPTEKTEYLANYKQYLITLYVPIFKKYNGQTMDIKGSRKIGNNQFIVTTEIKSESSNAPYKVEYRIKNSNNTYKVRDIIAEGISLINTQRSDFSSIISTKGISALNKNLIDKSS